MGKTFDLAKKQGLVQTRKISKASTTEEASVAIQDHAGNKQIFSHFMIIDFEATCWQDKSGSPANEIIEFPVVILDGHTGQILPEFFHKVQTIFFSFLKIIFCTICQFGFGFPVCPTYRRASIVRILYAIDGYQSKFSGKISTFRRDFTSIQSMAAKSF